MRESIKKFSEQMEQRLEENEHKGGWENTSRGFLENRLIDKTLDLLVAKDKESIIGNAVDIANYAMMLTEKEE